MGIRHGFGLFLQPMSTELGWGRETFALALAVQNLTWGATQPFAGMLADRFGSAQGADRGLRPVCARARHDVALPPRRGCSC